MSYTKQTWANGDIITAAKLNHMEDGIAGVEADAKSAIADDFSTSAAYAAGDYVIYNGHLYRFTAAHAAGAWTGTDAVQVQLAEDVEALGNRVMPTAKAYPLRTKTASGTEFHVNPAALPLVSISAEEACSVEFTGKNVMNPVPVGRSTSGMYNLSVGSTVTHNGVSTQYYDTDGETTECNIGSTNWMMLSFSSAPLKAGTYYFTNEMAFDGQEKIAWTSYITDGDYVVKSKVAVTNGVVTNQANLPAPTSITVEDGDRFVLCVGNYSSGTKGTIYIKFQLERGASHTAFEKFATPQTFTIVDASNIATPTFDLVSPSTFVYATKSVGITYYAYDEVADVSEDFSAFETVYKDIVDSENNLLNYGYDTSVNYIGNAGANNSSAVGIYRKGQLIKLNNATKVTDSVKIKITGEIQRTLLTSTVASWTGGFYFKAGHKYQFDLKQIAGTILDNSNVETNITLSVYLNGEATTIGSASYDTASKTYTRIVDGNDFYANAALFIAANYLLTDATFILTLRDITSNVVQDYYGAELADTVAKVRDATTSPAMVFLWATDIHRHSSNASGVQTFTKMIENMAAVAEAVPCDFILDTGDLTDGNTVQSTTLSRAYNCLTEFRSIGLPYIWAMGNHDTNPYINSGANKLTMDECYKAYFPAMMDVTHNSSESGTDYFVDFNGLNVRLISLNANNVHSTVPYAFSTNTATWLATALDTTKTVFVVLHQSPYSSQVYDNQTTTNAAGIRTALDAFVNNGGNLIMLSGHSHCDVAYISPFVSIMQSCQRFSSRNEDITDQTHGMTGFIDVVRFPAMEEGTATEDCWSVGVYKPGSNELSLIRFGAGKDRHFHITPIAPTTLTTKLSGTITWSSSDTSVATVASGVVTGVATGKCAILAKDDSGNYECWIVSVV